jgi:hypothetical protein
MRPELCRLAVVASAALLAVSGCGDERGDSGAAAPRAVAAEFPKPAGRTTEEIYASVEPAEDLVVSPTGQVFREGENRFGFGVFDLGHEAVNDAEVAIYAGPPDEPASGPFPARVESLETEPEFTAETTAADPDAAHVVYASRLAIDKPGEWRVVAMIRDGETLTAARTPSIEVADYAEIPRVGERAPRVHTPTDTDVADLDEIDTRDPHDTMHEVDFADVVGRRPAVVVFATPLLCESRVCGPVVDVAEQVKSQFGDDVAFIHMEIYEDNEVDKGMRPQVKAFGLQTEPWLFVIDDRGRVTTAVEGAFGVAELENAVREVAGEPS